DRSGRTLSGQTLDAFVVSIHHARPWSIGINCALGAREMRPYLAELSRLADCWVSVYPNAGLPNAFGEYDELPQETATLLREFLTSGCADIIGGCCGTTPAHVRALGEGVRSVLHRNGRRGDRSRPVPESPVSVENRSDPLQLSGLEPLIVREDSNFQ